LSADELIVKLKAAGWVFERNGKGSHKIFRNPNYAYPLPVPCHKGKEIHPGLLRRIMKDAGLL